MVVALEELAFAGHSAHFGGMSERATKRPEGFAKPAHWKNPPVPQPSEAKGEGDPDGLSPTRYGDWTRNGIAVDF